MGSIFIRVTSVLALAALLAPQNILAVTADDVVCDECVGTSDLAPTSVGSAKLKNGAVTTAKLKNGAVGTDKLKNGAVGTDKLKNGAVGTNKLKNGAVTYSKLDPNVLYEDPLLGTYSGAITWGQWDCTNPLDNGVYASSLMMEFSDQNGDDFSGTVTAEYEVPGYSWVATGSFVLTSYKFGRIAGTATVQSFVNNSLFTTTPVEIMGEMTRMGEMMAVRFKGVAGSGCSNSGNGLVEIE